MVPARRRVRVSARPHAVACAGALAALVIVAACGAPPSSPPGSPSPPPRASAPEEPPARAEPAIDAGARAQLDDAGASDGAADAAEPEPVTFEQPGTGACSVDDDCVMSNDKEDCCIADCSPRAMSVAEQKRLVRRCQPAKYRPCPLPRPCAPGSCVGVRARCAAGRCTLVCQKRTLP